MKIAILGTGNISKALATAFTRKGIEVLIGSRDPQKARALAGDLVHFATGGTIASAIHGGDVIVLSIPYKSVEETFRHNDQMKGKIIVDCTNALTWGENVSLALGHTTSAAEQIAKMVPGAHVVKAFNTAFAHLMEKGPYFGAHDGSMFYCGDDQTAKDTVKYLIEAAGFDPVDCGPLDSARLLEPMGVLLIRLSKQGYGNDIAYKLLRRS